jgi:hypothetical protein
MGSMDIAIPFGFGGASIDMKIGDDFLVVVTIDPPVAKSRREEPQE